MRTEKILTQHELTIDMSLPAMKALLEMSYGCGQFINNAAISCELDNFRNTLLNLIERGVDKTPEPVQTSKLDLI